VLGGLLRLVYDLYLALLVLGEDGGVVGSYEVLAVELFERPQVCLGIVDAFVFGRVKEHRIVTQFGLPSELFAALPASRVPNVVVLRSGFHHPMVCFP
jgi:hypothetical protein